MVIMHTYEKKICLSSIILADEFYYTFVVKSVSFVLC